jgi:hypothetical protein
MPLARTLSPFGGEREKAVAFGLWPNRIEPQARHYTRVHPRMAAWPNVKGLKPSRGTAATRLYAVSICG